MPGHKRLHVIYVPGLGDHNLMGQDQAVKHWQRNGVDSEVFQMFWNDNVAWKTKFGRLLKRIDELAENSNVALVGVSAGASAAINAYAARPDKIVGCVLIAGKVNRPGTIGQRLRQAVPSFVESAYACERALVKLDSRQRQRIMSRYSLLDRYVHKADSYIPGAHNRAVFGIGHVLTIATQIIFAGPWFIRFLKRQAANIK